MMGVAILGMFLEFIKLILEVMFYISGIFVAFKALKALNIYIDKNAR